MRNLNFDCLLANSLLIAAEKLSHFLQASPDNDAPFFDGSLLTKRTTNVLVLLNLVSVMLANLCDRSSQIS